MMLLCCVIAWLVFAGDVYGHHPDPLKIALFTTVGVVLMVLFVGAIWLLYRDYYASRVAEEARVLLA